MPKMTYTNRWIFYCNPKMWAIDEFLNDETQPLTWKVTDWQKDHFEVGQLGLIRVGKDTRTKKELDGKEKLKRGIYAIVEVIKKPINKDDTADEFWTDEERPKENAWRVELKCVHNLLSHPILLNDLKEIDGIKEDTALIKGRMTSSWSISKEHFDKVLEIALQAESEPFQYNQATFPKERIMQLVKGDFFTESEMKILTAFYSSENHQGTSPEIANFVGYNHFGAVNLIIGRIGKKLSQKLNIPLRKRSNGKFAYWDVFMEGEDISYGFRWRLKKPIVEAFQMLKIEKATPKRRISQKLSVQKAVSSYLKICKGGQWIDDEIYKFQFAHFIQQKVNWEIQSNEEILAVLIESQNLRYTETTQRGVQFLKKSGREKLSKFIALKDIELFRKIANGDAIQDIDWKDRTMSFPGLSAWLSALFPDQFYPIPLVGFSKTINYLFDTNIDKLPKKGEAYIHACQPFMQATEYLLKQYLHESFFLEKWNHLNAENSSLDFGNLTDFSRVDWVWLVQDFHLFVHREILGLYKTKQSIEVQEDIEPTAIEGASVLATHMRYERNATLVKKIKKQALKENPMLNCIVCGFSFLETYGEIGGGFIEAHHTEPLSERKEAKATAKEDMALVCSNCHRMLHKGNPVYSIEELKTIMQKATKPNS